MQVQLEDGTIAEFPDGTPDDVIEKALQQQAADSGKLSTSGSELANQLSLLTKNPMDEATAPQRAADARTQEYQFNNDQYKNAPALAKPAIAGMDILSAMTDMGTFGAGDRIGAGVKSLMSGKPYDEELAEARRQTQAAADRSGWAGTAAGVLGGYGALKAAGKAFPRVAAAMPSSLVPLGGGGVMRTGAGITAAGLEGTGLGAIDALGHGTDVKEGAISGGLGGLAGGLVAPTVGKAVSKGVGLVDDVWRKVTAQAPRNPRRMTIEGLRAAKNAAYDDINGVEFTPQATRDLSLDMNARLANQQHNPQLQRRAAATQEQIDRNLTSNRALNLKTVDDQRQLIGRQVTDSPGHFDEGHMANEMRNSIDDWLDQATTDPTMITSRSMPAEDAIPRLRDAHEFTRRERRSTDVETAILKGNRRANVNEGTRPDTAIRQNLQAILNDPKKSKGFTAEELAQMDEVAQGTTLANNARAISKRLQSPWMGAVAGGLGQAAVPGIGLGLAFAPAAVGKAIGSIAERSTYRGADKLLDRIATGAGPRDTAAMKKIKQSPEDIARMLMLLQMGQ